MSREALCHGRVFSQEHSAVLEECKVKLWVNEQSLKALKSLAQLSELCSPLLLQNFN